MKTREEIKKLLFEKPDNPALSYDFNIITEKLNEVIDRVNEIDKASDEFAEKMTKEHIDIYKALTKLSSPEKKEEVYDKEEGSVPSAEYTVPFLEKAIMQLENEKEALGLKEDQWVLEFFKNKLEQIVGANKLIPNGVSTQNGRPAYEGGVEGATSVKGIVEVETSKEPTQELRVTLSEQYGKPYIVIDDMKQGGKTMFAGMMEYIQIDNLTNNLK